jgi:formylglycine-generating enzyme required for sulfatase activity/HEAT repeat protein
MRLSLIPSALTSIILSWMIAATSPSFSQAPSPSTDPTPSPQTALGDRPRQLWQDHQLSLLLAGVLVSTYLGVLWIRPLLLLKLPSTDLSVPWTNWKIPLGIVRLLKYRNRVLDVWISHHWQTAQKEFANLTTVSDRSIHISLPVYLNRQCLDNLTGQALVPTFARKSAVLLITGEGGAGKTSLACQIAQWGLEKQISPHRLLPVLIETELDEQRSLVEAIRGQLNVLTNQAEPIAPELLEKLLHRQRVLVIVDHFSEMSATTRQQIRPDLADFPAKALVITSRLNEALDSVPKTVLEPLRIEGSRLSRFMDAYLEQRGKRSLFEDEDYFEACRRLSRMVGQRNITLLLARLYADQMIEQQQGAGGTLPASVPELMLSYLNQLNRAIEPENQRPDLAVQQDAQRIAWECLKQTYRPAAARRNEVITALSASNPEEPEQEPEKRLAYLEQRLRLLQTLEPGDKLRIVLDPLAEYLAALYLVDDCRDNPEARWQEFLDSIALVLDSTHDPADAIQGFLLAVRDCCLLKQVEAKVPVPVIARLAEEAGLDPEELRQIEERRRIRLLISDLSAPELTYRIRAAEDLGDRRMAAAMAVPNLLGMAENPNQAIAARQAALKALGQLGGNAALGKTIAPQLIALFQDVDDDLGVRRSAAEALGVMQAGRQDLLQLLEDEAQPLPLRQGAARALSRIGAPSGESVPMLIVELQENQINTQVKPIRVWQESLPENLILNLVEIPAGEFLMGSPADEEGRNVYSRSFPETEGLDLEMQHRVQVSAFSMSQFPITQAQWRAIATQPAINRPLNPDPANFKGQDRPVETVSWYDAVEFCDRLSKLTGKSYRLPSEAEWEYACRAGTLTPFHFGETLNPAIANYDGNYTYGPGEVGEYRNATTEVGSFGVVNHFGLAEMHGNVWEWCLDPWHPSYEHAPTDGTAWGSEGDDRYRLLRGGSWYNIPVNCRSAIRYRDDPGILNDNNGFRVVCGSPWTL